MPVRRSTSSRSSRGWCGSTRILQIQPDLAATWDDQPGRQDVYTFHINPDATFHDGRPVLAEDFKYSWERALKPETGVHRRGELPGRHRRGEGPVARPRGIRERHRSRRRYDAASDDRCAEAVLPLQAHVPDGVRRRQAPDRGEPAALDAEAERHRPVQAARSGGWASASSSRRTTRHHLGAPKLRPCASSLAGRIGAGGVRGRRHRHHGRWARRPGAHPGSGQPAERGVQAVPVAVDRLHRLQHEDAAVRRSESAAGVRAGGRPREDRARSC